MALPFRVLNRVQAALAATLLALVLIPGQLGVLQCVCTGKVVVGSAVAPDCTEYDDCPCGHSDPRDSTPCQDGSCWELIGFDAVDPFFAPEAGPALTAVQPSSRPEAIPSVPRNRDEPAPVIYPPPDPGNVSLPVLFSSFLI